MRKNLKKLALNLSQSDSKEIKECDTHLLYAKGPACILPNLFLGAHYNASNTNQLKHNHIHCIINVASEVPVTVPVQGIQYHHIQWTHCQSDLARSEFAIAIQTILVAHENHQNVLVHCQQGIERSAALVLAFLLYKTRLEQHVWTLDRAFKFVKERAPGIRPNMELLYQLREYEQSIAIKKQNIQTRTRRSESVACSAPSRFKKPKVSPLKRPRSLSFKESSSTHEWIVSATTVKRCSVDRHALAIAAILVVLSAMYHQHSCHLSSDHLFIKTVYNINV